MFWDVVFALLPLALIVLPITALIVLHAVQTHHEKKAAQKEHTI